MCNICIVNDFKKIQTVLMLHSISWGLFFSALFLLTVAYYFALSLYFFRKEFFALVRRQLKRLSILMLAMVGVAATLHAQTADGNTGISQANTLIRSYWANAVLLMYAIGSLVGIIGAVRVFQIWNSSHREDVGKAAAGWFGSMVFLVVVATIIQSFFGI
jgi:hypothetical protein